jgi:isopentenyl diphosphate isomerase/L-lactate dehydrogenase-like FMN-dependent dehydrogenase
VEAATPGVFKPFVQSLYVDLAEMAAEPPRPIHLGFRAGRDFMNDFLNELAGAGVNHVILNLKYGRRSAAEVLEEIGREVIPRLGTGTPPVDASAAG